jgi:hypothetical protein
MTRFHKSDAEKRRKKALSTPQNAPFDASHRRTFAPSRAMPRMRSPRPWNPAYPATTPTRAPADTRRLREAHRDSRIAQHPAMPISPGFLAM